jgi:hypothetical protein
VGGSALKVEIQEVFLGSAFYPQHGRPGRRAQFLFLGVGYEKSLPFSLIGTSGWQYFQTDRRLGLGQFAGGGEVIPTPGAQVGQHGGSFPLVLRFAAPGVVVDLTVTIPQATFSLGGVYKGYWWLWKWTP